MQARVEEKIAEVLDIRGVESPSNVLSVLKRASALPNGGALQIRADCNPWQLYDLLQQRGFFLAMEKQKDGSYLGRITQRDLARLSH